jgi:hypothetical protein
MTTIAERSPSVTVFMWTIMSVNCVLTPALALFYKLPSPGDDEDEFLDEEAKEERALLAVDDGEGQGEGEDSGPEDISALVSVRAVLCGAHSCLSCGAG